MKALVTGGKGYLGKYIIRELLKKNVQTISYDINHSDTTSSESGNLIAIQGDILDRDALENAMEGCNVVFHTAALADLDEAQKKPMDTMKINVLGTTNCLEVAKDLGIDRFMFSSSVYASGNYGSFYRISKQAGESLCKNFHEEYGLKYTILRYGSLYGSEANHWNFIMKVCKDLVNNKKVRYNSSPNSVREYIHISDASRETVRIATDSDFINKIVMISGHQRMTVSELFDMIGEILGHEIEVEYTSDKEHRHYVMTPYSLNKEIPVRINLSTYVDINEGILDCLKKC